MNDSEYATTQDKLMELVKEVSAMDLEGFLQRINLSEGVASVLDPSAYVQGMHNLQVIKRLATGLNGFKNAIDKERELAVRELERMANRYG